MSSGQKLRAPIERRPSANAPSGADASPSLPLREFVDRHFETIAAGLLPSTQRSHRSIIVQQLMPIFGDVKLDSITSIAVIDFKVRLRNEGLAPSYINDCVRVFKMLLHQAVEREVIAVYPLRKRVPREKEPLLRLEMTDEERRAFLTTFDDFASFAAYLARTQRKGKVVESSHFGSTRNHVACMFS